MQEVSETMWTVGVINHRQAAGGHGWHKRATHMFERFRKEFNLFYKWHLLNSELAHGPFWHHVVHTQGGETPSHSEMRMRTFHNSRFLVFCWVCSLSVQEIDSTFGGFLWNIPCYKHTGVHWRKSHPLLKWKHQYKSVKILSPAFKS